MKRKVAGILLLFCLVTSFVMAFTFLQIQKIEVKQEVEEKMSEGGGINDLVLLKFTAKESKTELKWEHSREFEYKGQMYDVVKKSIHGDTIHYWCFWDHEETKLNKQLAELISKVIGNNPQNQENKNQLVDFFKKLICEKQNNHLVVISRDRTDRFIYADYFLPVYHIPPVPPPRFS